MAYGSIRVDKTTVYFGQQVVFTPSFFEYENNVVVTYSFAGTSTRTGSVFSGSDLDQYGKYTWTVPAGLAQYCSGESGACTITAKFYVGSTLTGTRTLTLSFLAYRQQVVRVPDSVAKNGANFGDSVTLTTGRYGAISGVDLRYSFTGSSTTAGNIATGVTSSYNWTVPNLAANCISSVSGICTITATCKVGDVAVRTETVQITLKVPDTAAYKPSLPSGSITLTEANSAVTSSGLGVYLQGESKVAIAVNPTAAYQSPIVKCAVTFDGNGYTDTSSPFSITSATITKSGTAATRSVAWTVTVTDQRGRSASATGTITAYLYNRPSITTQFTGQRCDSSGTYQHDGTIVKVTFAGKYTVLSKNSYTTKIAYSADNGSTYTDAKSYTASSGAVSASNDRLTNITYLNTTKYLMRLTLADKLYTTTAVITIPTLKVLLDFRADGTGLGIGMINQNANAIDSAWKYNGSDMSLTGRIDTKITQWDNATAPSANRSYDTHYVMDANNRTMTLQRLTHDTDNSLGVEYGVRRQVSSSSTLWNTLALRVGADGTRSVRVSDAAAWRTALGLGSAATQASTAFAAASHTHSYLPLAGGTLTGQLILASAGLKTNQEAGYTLNQFGNFIHQRNNTGDTWHICNNAGTSKIAVTFESGATTIEGAVTVNNSLNINNNRINFKTGSTSGAITPIVINNSSSTRADWIEVRSSNRWMFGEYKEGSSYYERFDLPDPTTTTAHKYYYITTTKTFQRGTVNASSIAANSYKSGTVTFATPYTNAPVVVVGLYGGGDNVSAFGSVSVRVKAMSTNTSGQTTGFTYEIDNASSGSRNIGMMWMAYADA